MAIPPAKVVPLERPSEPPADAARPDPLLAAFLGAPDLEKARMELGDLLERHVTPVVRAVIRGQLGADARLLEGQDREDVLSGVMLRLAAHLWPLRSTEGRTPIADFLAYAAATTHNACHAFVRRRFPERARMRSRLRYVLSRDPGLALWQGASGEWLCGLSAWRGRPTAPDSVQRLDDMRARLGRLSAGQATRPAAAHLIDLLWALLKGLRGPCRFDDLAAAIGDTQGLPGATAGLEADGARHPEPARLADPGPTPAESAEQREFLERLWGEVRLLPLNQRWALLLNLRDPEGGGMIGLFPLTGVASVPEIAAALEMEEERLTATWPDLPCDDAWIAGELGVTRRQVINLRKCARERLARRMRRAMAEAGSPDAAW
jgi:DNA-directed RNA polymerase specialized sigma24 family protein